MHEPRFTGSPDRPRSSGRIARVEVERAVPRAFVRAGARRVLGIGAGTGFLGEAFLQAGRELTGIDLNPQLAADPPSRPASR